MTTPRPSDDADSSPDSPLTGWSPTPPLSETRLAAFVCYVGLLLAGPRR
jgi:hypothetical protein